jgi:hypothetical protein
VSTKTNKGDQAEETTKYTMASQITDILIPTSYVRKNKWQMKLPAASGRGIKNHNKRFSGILS